MQLIYLLLLWKFKALIHDQDIALLADPLNLNSTHGTMSFSMLVDGFIDIIIMHLFLLDSLWE